jgi:GTPase SAR1 family protein
MPAADANVACELLGKSSLAVQFVDGHFVESYYPTIENTFSKVIRFKGQDYATEIVDTAGQVRTTDPRTDAAQAAVPQNSRHTAAHNSWLTLIVSATG